jgi:hypothetical protein
MVLRGTTLMSVLKGGKVFTSVFTHPPHDSADIVMRRGRWAIWALQTRRIVRGMKMPYAAN